MNTPSHCAARLATYACMSIGVCVRMGEWTVALFTLALPFLIVMLSQIMRVENALRKELDWLEAAEGQCYYSDDM